MNASSKTQQSAQWLGYLGLIPFLGAGLLLTNISRELILTGIHSYAAIILTFIGAIHWGRAISTDTGDSQAWLIIISITPSLVAWLSLFLQPLYGLPTLIAAFLLLLAFDYKQYRDLHWFRRLRVQLTSTVCLILLFCLFLTGEATI